MKTWCILPFSCLWHYLSTTWNNTGSAFKSILFHLSVFSVFLHRVIFNAMWLENVEDIWPLRSAIKKSFFTLICWREQSASDSGDEYLDICDSQKYQWVKLTAGLYMMAETPGCVSHESINESWHLYSIHHLLLNLFLLPSGVFVTQVLQSAFPRVHT